MVQSPNRRITSILTVSASVGTVLFAATALVTAKPEPPDGTPTSRQKFKNIRVLKDLPADQLIPTMHRFNVSLGVHCDFCHVVKPNHTGFELDDKPAKQTTRKMILMVQDMNKREKVLAGQSTCFMCHHGQPRPDLRPPTASK